MKLYIYTYIYDLYAGLEQENTSAMPQYIKILHGALAVHLLRFTYHLNGSHSGMDGSRLVQCSLLSNFALHEGEGYMNCYSAAGELQVCMSHAVGMHQVHIQ